MTSIILDFPTENKTSTHGIALTNFRVATDPDGNKTTGPPIRIQGTKGEIQVYGPAYRPTKYRIIMRSGKGEEDVKYVDCPIPGQGMFWEADECARCLRDGKLESEGLTLGESVVIMEAMDEVRRQNGLRYPDKIESTEYPLEL